MKQLILAVSLAFALAPAAYAADPVKKEPSAAQKAQQEKMKQCNADAGEKKLAGDERKTFMSKCLSEKKASQQDKMKSCNKDAGDKKLAGDERKKFMSGCLKG
ncbi:MAG: PsiF family protein [Burkholderiales bacterium]